MSIRTCCFSVVLSLAVVGVACKQSTPTASASVDVESLRPYLPSQSHTMMDVAYQWENLWYAAQKKNWPLAGFYFNETRNHILWTIRIRPVRKDAEGMDVDLKSIFDALDASTFAAVKIAIAQKDSTKFESAYKQALDGCYSCHKASSLPYLRPVMPSGTVGPAEGILDFTPVPEAP